MLSRLARCGTTSMGQMQLCCTACGASEWRPLGCQDRHCPSCGVRRTEDWAQARTSELLAVPYFHFVFTVPGELYPLFRANPQELYGLFFSSMAQTLTAFAAKRRFLGGTPAFFAVLHTTNRRLGYHPHLHVVIAGAAYDTKADQLRVVRKDDFLFPVRDLAAFFRARFLAGLAGCFDKGVLELVAPALHRWTDVTYRQRVLAELACVNWQLRTEAIDGEPERVIRYLSRYIFRTAISNARLLSFDGRSVTYGWVDRRSGERRTAALPLMEFLRRFAAHILPKGFQRVRFYGLLAPSNRRTALVLAQRAAIRRANLRGFALSVACTLRPEQVRPLCCVACGAEALAVTTIIRGSYAVHLAPRPHGIPPPQHRRPTRRGAA
ncbi:MAG: transposase [Anaerolineae bacterium]|nr:transposase [Anaerolineae bacterium]